MNSKNEKHLNAWVITSMWVIASTNRSKHWKVFSKIKVFFLFSFEEFMEPYNTINNLNLAKIVEKYVWRSSFLVKLQVCRLKAVNFNKWTPSQVFFKDFT